MITELSTGILHVVRYGPAEEICLSNQKSSMKSKINCKLKGPDAENQSHD